MHPFRFDRAAAERSIRDPDGALWPVSAYADADELDLLLQAALDTGAIARPETRARLYIYPLSLAEPDPLPAVDPGAGPTLLGHSLKLTEREGEDPVTFTLRLLEEIVEEANGLAPTMGVTRARSPGPGEAPSGSTRLAHLAEVEVDRPDQLDELVRLAADAEIGLTVYEEPPCTCSEVRGCPQCFARADGLVGALVRDDRGREWEVTEVDEKDGFPTVCGKRHWALLEDVEVLHELR